MKNGTCTSKYAANVALGKDFARTAPLFYALNAMALKYFPIKNLFARPASANWIGKKLKPFDVSYIGNKGATCSPP